MADYFDIDAHYRTGTPASDRLVAETRALCLRQDREHLDAMRAWVASDPPAVRLVVDVLWAIGEIERARPDLKH